MITNGVICIRVLRVVRETVSLLSSTTSLRRWVCRTWCCRPSFPKCRWLPKNESGDIKSHGFWRGSIIYWKVPRFCKWVSLINIRKITVLVEAKGQCYYTVNGGRGASVLSPGHCNKPLTCVSSYTHKDKGFGTETEDLVYSRIFTASIGHIFFLGMKENSPIFEPFFCQFYKNACNFINIFKRYSFVNI